MAVKEGSKGCYLRRKCKLGCFLQSFPIVSSLSVVQKYERAHPFCFLQCLLVDLFLDFSNPLLSLLMLSVATASCGMSLKSWVATTQRRIFFHLCFYLMFHQFQWVVPSSAIKGFQEQQFCIQYIWGLDDFVNFDSAAPQPPPLPASFIPVILFILADHPCIFYNTPPLPKGLRLGFHSTRHCRKHIRNLYSERLRQTKSGEKVKKDHNEPQCSGGPGAPHLLPPLLPTAGEHLELLLFSDMYFLSVSSEPV